MISGITQKQIRFEFKVARADGERFLVNDPRPHLGELALEHFAVVVEQILGSNHTQDSIPEKLESLIRAVIRRVCYLQITAMRESLFEERRKVDRNTEDLFELVYAFIAQQSHWWEDLLERSIRRIATKCREL